MERLHEDEEKPGGKAIPIDVALMSTRLVLRVSGREELPTVRLFTEFVDIIDSIAADWKIEWETWIDATCDSLHLT